MKPLQPELSRAPETRIGVVEKEVRRQPEIAGFQSYESFVNNNKALEADFVNAEEGNPDLTYSRLQQTHLDELVLLAQTGAERALVILLGSEPDLRVDALFDSIEYRQAEIFLVYMSARMNDKNLLPRERAEAAEWFKLTNEAVYGIPDNKVFGAIARKHLLPHLETVFEDPQAQKIQAELRNRIGVITDDGHELAAVNPDAKAHFNTLIRERFDETVSHIVPRYEEVDGEQREIKYTPQEIAEVIEIALQKIGATELGWHCEVVEDKELIAVSAHQKIVEVGANRESASAAVLKGKVIHEVCVHALRSVNAEKAGWLSATYGQQRYLDFEEAFANAAGEAYWGEALTPGPEYRYMAAALAYGFDGHEPRDMRDTYEIMWRTIALDRPSRNKKSSIEKAKATAYLQCMRIFRGTPADIPGLLYTKDLTYINGREVVNPVIEMIETQEDIDFLLAGKLDPTLEDHLPIAEDIVPGAPIAAKIRERYGLVA
jgi:hypothetical protein